MVEERKIPKDYKSTEIGMFPPEWEIIAIEDLVARGIIEKPLDGNHGSLHPKSKDYVYDGIPFIMANNVVDGKVDLENCNFIRKEQADKLKKGFSIYGDVLLTHKGTIGNVAIVENIKTDYIMLTPQVTYYRICNESKLINSYVKYYFESEIFQNSLKNFAGGGTRAYIGISKQRKLNFVLPPLSEQLAIAEVLNDVDNLITYLEKLIDKKQKIKQGTMQKLLTGKRRLPGFTGELGVKKLGDIAEIKKGQLITENDVVPGNIPVIAGGMKPSYYHNNPNRWGKTITISASGANAGYVSFHNQPIFASDCSTIEENINYSIEFICYQLKLRQNNIYSMQTGGAQPHIYSRDIKPIEIYFPKLKEQQAIAQILSDMDDEIERLEYKLEKYKSIKQGMMQELLTGRIRLV